MPSKAEVILLAGRFKIGIDSDIPFLIEELENFYSITDYSNYCDFHVSLNRVKGLRRYIRPQVTFSFSNSAPFEPFPYTHAFPLLEWGLNWCVTRHYHETLVMHAAVVEKNGSVLVLPGEPGAGKSTLSAAFSGAGWQLFSDELTLIDLETSNVLPNPRPISLKNQSIDIIKKRHSTWYSSPPVLDTIKGTVSLFNPGKPNYDPISYVAKPRLLVFPKLNLSGKTEIKKIPKTEAMIRFADQAFNYSIIGEKAFVALAKFVDHSSCYEFTYDGDLDKAVRVMDELYANDT